MAEVSEGEVSDLENRDAHHAKEFLRAHIELAYTHDCWLCTACKLNSTSSQPRPDTRRRITVRRARTSRVVDSCRTRSNITRMDSCCGAGRILESTATHPKLPGTARHARDKSIPGLNARMMQPRQR